MSRLLLSLAVLGGLAADARADDAPRFGAMVDLGVPSGASASVVYRPLRALRLHAGGAHNLVGPGVQGGVALAPIGTWVTPIVAVEAGRFFARDANAAVERVAGAPMAIAPEALGYDYASAQLGLELGPRWATFYLHAGVSAVRATWHGDDTTTDGEGAVSTTTDVAVDAIGVSAGLGLIVYLAR